MTTSPRPRGRLPDVRPGKTLLAQVLGYQVARADIVTRTLFQAAAGVPFGMRPVDYTVLALLVQDPDGSPARLARALGVTPPHVSAIIDRLEEAGWIERQPRASDRRSHVLRLTREGESVARKATDAIVEAEAALPLTPGERTLLGELLQKVARAAG